MQELWALTRWLSLGLKQQQKTWCVWPSSVRRHCLLRTSHSLSVKSSEAVHRYFPSRSQHTSERP